MNFYTLASTGYIFIAVILIYIIFRDQKNPGVFFGRHKKMAWFIICSLIFTSVIAYYTRFVEPFQIITRNQEIKISGIEEPIKIVFITDPQLNRFKSEYWVKEITAATDKNEPDIILFGGDLISNGGYFYDPGGSGTADTESDFLSDFNFLTKKYLSFFTLGNHEYGLGNSSRENDRRWTGNKSIETVEAMTKIGSVTLINKLKCLEVKQQKICLFGIDDIWGAESGQTKVDFSELKKWDQKTPLIFLTHNPDGILLWPKDIKKPDLVLAGHTHGGQIYLPIIGPMGGAGIELGEQFYRGLNYYNGIPIYTSVGLGESGGPIRFMSAPELTVMNLVPWTTLSKSKISNIKYLISKCFGYWILRYWILF